MPSVEELKAHLSASVSEAELTATAIRGVADGMEETLSRLRLTAAGTAHPALVDAITRLEQAKLRLDEAQALTRGAIDAANIYRTVA